MVEPQSNIGYVCNGQEPKPGGYTEEDPYELLGYNVKTSFRAQNGRTEHMWVFVSAIDPDDESVLLGVLNNDPVYATQYHCGQDVKVALWEIEDVFEYSK